MKNLLSADLYKLRHLKSFWVCLFINIGLALANILLIQYSNGGAPNGMAALDYFLRCFSTSTPLLACISVSIFAAGEFGYGTMKNIASHGFSRSAIFFSKTLVGWLISLVYTIGYFLFTFFPALIFWGMGTASETFVTDALVITSLQILLTLAFSTLFTAVAFLLRQSGGAMAISICIMQFSLLGASLLQLFLQEVLHIENQLPSYLISSCMNALYDPLTQEVIQRCLLVGFGFLALFLLCGLLSFRKRDIK